MKELARILAILASAMVLIASPAAARETVTVIVEEWVEVPASRFVAGADLTPAAIPGTGRQGAIDSFGPFRVLTSGQAALVGVTDEDSPAQFGAMLAAYPELEVLQLVEAPGTYDDRANLALGRMIRAAGLETHVPSYGSVRSGAVELVFAGTHWRIDAGAEFAVHAWMDDLGRSAGDYSPDAPEHRKYLAYYSEMGVPPQQAQAFYAMTNAAPFENPRWLDAAEMRSWLGLEVQIAEGPEDAPEITPQIAYAAL